MDIQNKKIMERLEKRIQKDEWFQEQKGETKLFMITPFDVWEEGKDFHLYVYIPLKQERKLLLHISKKQEKTDFYIQIRLEENNKNVFCTYPKKLKTFVQKICQKIETYIKQVVSKETKYRIQSLFGSMVVYQN